MNDKPSRVHVQQIAKYGYWGTKEGIGSLAEVKKLVDPKYQGAINDGIALAVTQAALWKYGNQDPNLEFGGNNINGDEGGGTYKTEELLEFFYDKNGGIHRLTKEQREAAVALYKELIKKRQTKMTLSLTSLPRRIFKTLLSG